MKIKWFGVLASFVFVFAGMWAAQGECGSAKDTTWRLGTTKEGGFSYNVGVGLAKVVSDNTEAIYLEALPSPGYAANVRLVSGGSFELGITQAAVIDAAYQKQPPFKKNPVSWPPYQMATVFTGEFLVIAKAKLGLKSWNDLAGKKMFLGPKGSGSYVMARKFLQTAGIYDKIKEVQMGYSDAAAACAEGRIDAIFAYTTCGTRSMPGWLRDVDSRWKFNYVPPNEEQRAKCSALTAVYGMNVPTPAFSNRDEMGKSIYALIAPAIIIARPDLEAEKVYKLTKGMFENSKAITQIVAGFKQFDEEKEAMNKESINSIANIPVHPGAARYLKEIGIWQKDWVEGKVTPRP